MYLRACTESRMLRLKKTLYSLELRCAQWSRILDMSEACIVIAIAQGTGIFIDLLKRQKARGDRTHAPFGFASF